jgi:hypothetical protein
MRACERLMKAGISESGVLQAAGGFDPQARSLRLDLEKGDKGSRYFSSTCSTVSFASGLLRMCTVDSSNCAASR